MSRTNTSCTGCGVGLWRDKEDDDRKQPWCGSCYERRDSILERRAVVAMIPLLEVEVVACPRRHARLRKKLAKLREILGLPAVELSK